MKRALAPFLAAVLLLSAFPPVGLWPLAWVAFVPWLRYLDGEKRTWRAALLGYAAGVAFFTAGLWWLRYIWAFAPLALGAIYGLQWGLFVLGVRLLRAPRVVSVPAVWVALEWLRGNLPVSGLPWFELGVSQADFLPLIQSADLAGVHLVSAVMLSGQALLAQVWVARERRPAGAAIGWGAAFLALCGYGLVRSATLELREGPRLLVVQPNIPQDVKEIVLKQKEDPAKIEQWRDSIYEKLMRLTDRRDVDLVVWPEAAFLHPIRVRPGSAEPFAHTPAQKRHVRLLADGAARSGAPLLAGTVLFDETGDYNSALLVDVSGRPIARYDKVILVPFGEYMPFGFLRGVTADLTNLSYVPDTTPGSGWQVMRIGDERFGPLICFEGVIPAACRGMARRGAGFIVNISNDGWFRDSAELDQILQIVRVRAIECRLGFVRATNTGISAFIRPDGRVESVLEGPEGRVKEVEGTLEGVVRIAEGGSLYRLWGDVAVWAILAWLVGLEISVRRRGPPV